MFKNKNDITKLKLSMSEDKNKRNAQKQENFNKLNMIKFSKDKFFLVDSQIGIGTIYSLQTIFNSINDTFLTYSIDYQAELLDNIHGENIILDVNASDKDVSTEDIYKKLEEFGFKKIILVTRFITEEPEDKLSEIMVD